MKTEENVLSENKTAQEKLELDKGFSCKMESTLLKPPKELNLQGNVGENWKKWKQKFLNYLLVTQSEDKDDKLKCAILLHVIGDESVDIFNTFNLKPEEKNKFNILLKKFEDYFIPRTNVTYERFKFRTRIQSKHESIDQFVTDLKAKSLTCEFGDLSESLIRDQITLGIQNESLRERLLRENLNLQQTIDICRAAEISSLQSKDIKQDASRNEDIHAVQGSSSFRKNQPTRRTTALKVNSGKKCYRCDRQHPKFKCPAHGKMCNKCKKSNHFAICCKSKNLHMFEKETSEKEVRSDYLFIGALGSNNKKETDNWSVRLEIIPGQFIDFKLDTGAHANVIPLQIYNKLNLNRKSLLSTNLKLTSYCGKRLPIVGKCFLKCQYKSMIRVIEFQVVDTQSPPVLGLNTCETMKLVARIDKVTEECKYITNKEDIYFSNIMNEYNDVFNGVGLIPGKHNIKIDNFAKPVIHAPRKVPEPLIIPLKKELERLEILNIIEKVIEPTNWVNSMVIVRKPSGQLRICLDPKDLNFAIKREHFQLPTLEEITNKLCNAKIFSTLDAQSGFWQIALNEESSKLCTFNTPFGRYKFLRLPFGIKSAPEVFHRTIRELFENIEGVDTFIDDILIWGSTQEEHDLRLRKVLNRAREVNLKFNKEKCKFNKQELIYMGHKLTSEGIKPDENKVRTIENMQVPKNKKDVQRLLGMVTYLSKFIPNMSSVTSPMRELIKNNREWQWQWEQEKAFKEIKKLVSSQPLLYYYDVNKPVTMSVDASKDGVAAVLLQNNVPVAYASRALSDCQKGYATIEKEMAAIVFGCNKFYQYIYGKHVVIETDHKPLVSIYKKPLVLCPPRLQRMLINIQKFDYSLVYKPGKEMYLADTLSRAYQSIDKDKLNSIDTFLDNEIEAQVCTLTLNLPITSEKIKIFQNETKKDYEMQQLYNCIKEGWPKHKTLLPNIVKPYWNVRGELSETSGLIFKNQQLVVPENLRQDMLNRIHLNHSGIEVSKSKARELLYWPGMSKNIEDLVSSCNICLRYQKSNTKQSLMPHSVPDRPWSKVGIDLFYLDDKDYVLLVDYYSKFIEIMMLSNTTSPVVITCIKSIFARHGIPDIVQSDNGPQFSSQMFKDFAKEWDFQHITSSARFPQSNGMVERAIQTTKTMIKKAKATKKDIYLCLLEQRNTTISKVNYSPAQLLMGRRLKGVIPIINSRLKPSKVNAYKVKQTLQAKQKIQKFYFDKNSKLLHPFHVNDNVRVKMNKEWIPAVVYKAGHKPRSYIISLPNGRKIERNRKDIIKDNSKMFSNNPYFDEVNRLQETIIPNIDCDPNQQEGSKELTTRYGRIVKQPDRLQYC